MKGIFQRKQTPLCFVAVAVVRAGISPGQLQRTFPCFGAAVAEKGAVKSRTFREALRQFCLVFVIEEIRSVNQLPCLLLENLLDRWMSVAQRIHADSAEEIQIALAGRIPEIYSATASEQHFLPVISWEQQFLLSTDCGGEVHAPMTSVP